MIEEARTGLAGRPRLAPGASAALFVTCLVDLFHPEVGLATVEVLRRAGLRVTFPAAQTCCGQPLFNSGYRADARRLARRFVDLFSSADAVVAPSGSCVYMVKHEYPLLFAADPVYRQRAELLARRTFDLASFLVDVVEVVDLGARCPARVTYHDSCHLCRGLGVRKQPRALLRAVQGLELVEMEEPDRCCGFGGTFAVRLPEISAAMLARKLQRARKADVEAVVTSDVSCGMQMAGGLSRAGGDLRVVHLAQVLAGEGRS